MARSAVASALRRQSNLKRVFTEIIKINHTAIKQIIVYEIYVTVEVIINKLIGLIIISKERKDSRAQILEPNFFECAEIAKW